jgi:hypothetical protein
MHVLYFLLKKLMEPPFSEYLVLLKNRVTFSYSFIYFFKYIFNVKRYLKRVFYLFFFLFIKASCKDRWSTKAEQII